MGGFTSCQQRQPLFSHDSILSTAPNSLSQLCSWISIVFAATSSKCCHLFPNRCKDEGFLIQVYITISSKKHSWSLFVWVTALGKHHWPTTKWNYHHHQSQVFIGNILIQLYLQTGKTIKTGDLSLPIEQRWKQFTKPWLRDYEQDTISTHNEYFSASSSSMIAAWFPHL